MRNILIIARRELAAYFSTPLAYVFLVAFLVSAGAIPFFMGNFLERGQADLQPFFAFHPWLFLVLIPAVGMRLWAEERRTGTIEFLMTLPVTTWEAVLGKFLAAWVFTGVALALTFPMWITVNYLGDPDNGVILASYLGSFLMAGAFLALASCISAVTKSQVIAFVLAVGAGMILMVSGLDLFLGLFRSWAPQIVIDLIASFSFITHFGTIAAGVLELRAIVFFLSLILLFLAINGQVVELKKAG
jgi:ABC-2 type transport system permease protein